jgi:hypothetical protein
MWWINYKPNMEALQKGLLSIPWGLRSWHWNLGPIGSLDPFSASTHPKAIDNHITSLNTPLESTITHKSLARILKSTITHSITLICLLFGEWNERTLYGKKQRGKSFGNSAFVWEGWFCPWKKGDKLPLCKLVSQVLCVFGADCIHKWKVRSCI